MFASCLALSCCIRTTRKTATTSTNCISYASREPIRFSYQEFDKQLTNFQKSKFKLDAIAIISRPGKQENMLKRLIQDANGYVLITLKNGMRDSVRLNEVNAVAFVSVADTSLTGYYSVGDDSATAHAPVINLLVRKLGYTCATYQFNIPGYPCSNDSISQQTGAGYSAAQLLLRL